MSDLFDLPFEEDEPEPELEPAAAPLASRRILTVTDLTIKIRDRLESDFFEVWVEGELSNCKIWNTDHLFFTLKPRRKRLRWAGISTAR